MKKKLIKNYAWFAVVTLFVGMLISFAGCTSDDVCSNYYGEYSEAEIYQIKNLAKQYGLYFGVNRNHTGLKKTMKEYESMFKNLSGITGIYNSSLDKSNRKICFYHKKNIANIRLKSGSESGKWEGRSSTADELYFATATISWNFEELYLHQLDMTADIHKKGYQGEGATTMRNKSVSRLGYNGIIFSCLLDYVEAGDTAFFAIDNGTCTYGDSPTGAFSLRSIAPNDSVQ